MKKVLLLLAFVLTVFVLSGCSKKSEIVEISGEEMFNQEGNYYIFFYQDDCEDCEQIEPIIEAYVEAVKEETKYQHKSTVYKVNLSKDENKKILRSYTGGLGQGTNGDFFVDDVQDWKDLYIPTTSSLISIKTNSQNVTYAAFEAEGAQNIFNFLTAYLDS